jgi:hypothetical protein
LLQFLRSAPNEEVANYVNLIDTQKGIWDELSIFDPGR